jgi:hypothetical protein
MIFLKKVKNSYNFGKHFDSQEPTFIITLNKNKTLYHKFLLLFIFLCQLSRYKVNI